MSNKQKKNIDYNSQTVKTEIINYLYNCIDVSKHKYSLLKTFDDLKSLKETEHHVSPNFSGKNAFIIFKKLNKGYYSILVDRKTLKYNKSHIDIQSVRFMPLNIKARADIYNGTILDGKLIKVENNKNIFLITDIFYLDGKDLTEEKIENKLINIKIYLEQNIKIDNKTSKISFDINKLYNYNQIKELIEEGKNHNLYNMYGIIFYPKKSGITVLFNDLEIKNNIIEQKDESYIYVQFRKRDIPDVYDTFIINESNRLARCGIAYIPTLKISKYCYEVFLNEKKKDIVFKCVYNNDFNKFCPIEKAENISKPDTLEKIKTVLQI